MLTEVKVLVTLYTRGPVSKEVVEQEIIDLLTASGGVLSDDSLGADSVNAKFLETPK